MSETFYLLRITSAGQEIYLVRPRRMLLDQQEYLLVPLMEEPGGDEAELELDMGPFVEPETIVVENWADVIVPEEAPPERPHIDVDAIPPREPAPEETKEPKERIKEILAEAGERGLYPSEIREKLGDIGPVRVGPLYAALAFEKIAYRAHDGRWHIK